MVDLGIFVALGIVALAVCLFFGVTWVFVGVFGAVARGIGRLFGFRSDGYGDMDVMDDPAAWGRRICPRAGCGRANVPQARFCAQCGARLV